MSAGRVGGAPTCSTTDDRSGVRPAAACRVPRAGTVGPVAKRLLKSEPDEFGYDDLVRNKREGWDGVRNYQARNFMDGS